MKLSMVLLSVNASAIRVPFLTSLMFLVLFQVLFQPLEVRVGALSASGGDQGRALGVLHRSHSGEVATTLPAPPGLSWSFPAVSFPQQRMPSNPPLVSFKSNF